MIITIDGPAAAGKGTISALLSEKYNFVCFDTGMLYRAVGLQMVLTGQELQNIEAATKIASSLTYRQMMELSVHPDFRSDIGGQAASVVSSYQPVRTALLEMQRSFGKDPKFANGEPANGVIFDGRDTGTVVFPDADLKFFIVADTEVRARRRYNEFISKNIPCSYEKVLADMKERDERDKNRATAPMKPADDAIIIDCSELSIDEVMDVITPIVKEKFKAYLSSQR